MVLKGFLIGFWSIFQTHRAPANVRRRKPGNATQPQFLRVFKHFAANARKATKKKISSKIVDKTHVFRNVGFQRILGGFGTSFGRSKSLIFEPQAVQEAKKTPTSEQKRSEKRRRRPRSAPERKMAPTCKKKIEDFLGRWHGGASLKHVKTGI